MISNRTFGAYVEYRAAQMYVRWEEQDERFQIQLPTL